MNVYVAGKTQALRDVRLVQALVRHTGHEITHDWTQIVLDNGGDVSEVEIPQEKRQEYALADMNGVYHCNLLIAVGHPRLCGTLWELGAAAMLGRKIWLVNWDRCRRVSVFEDLPNVEKVSIQTLGERLWDISAKRLEMEPPRPWRVTETETGLRFELGE